MAGEDPGHVLRVKLLPCRGCRGFPVDAHHTGHAGMAQRTHDHTAVPLCRACHQALHERRGAFAGMGAPAVHRWESDALAATLRDIAAMEDLPC